MGERFDLVDVSHDRPFTGNPLAVVAAAEDIGTETMQRMTRWFNLSETAFLLPPDDSRADYKVRIFTLERELPFAGHPTLGRFGRSSVIRTATWSKTR
jgi:PhzF family phenazine biosynthesis protein